MASPQKVGRNKKLMSYRAKGWSFRKIAKKFDLSVSTVYEIYQHMSKRKLST